MYNIGQKMQAGLRFIVFGGLCLLFTAAGSAALAQPVVELRVEPDVRTLYLDADLQELLLETRVSDSNVHFQWNLDGPGRLLGDLESPGNIYSLPKRLEGESAQAVISLTVTTQAAYEITRTLVFQLLPSLPPVPPSPTPLPPGWHFLPVPAGTYQLNAYLQRYIQYPGLSAAIVIEQPFSIQAGEVTVGEFRRYLESVDREGHARVTSSWNQDRERPAFRHDQPVENISWEEANAYAQWLGQQTGWDVRLPTVRQWAAACVKYAEALPVLQTTANRPVAKIRGDIDHLLGNLREWSADACKSDAETEEQYRLLGENYMTDPNAPEVIGKGHCTGAAERWAGVGFRVVRIDSQIRTDARETE